MFLIVIEYANILSIRPVKANETLFLAEKFRE